MKSENVIFKVSNANNIGEVILDDSIHEQYEDEKKYVDKIWIELENNGEKIGELACTIFDNLCILNDNEDIVDVADRIGQDEFSSLVVLKSSGLLGRDLMEINEELSYDKTTTVYIDHLAITKKYRRKGYAQWLLKNYIDIIDNNYNMKVDAAIIYVNPQKFNFQNESEYEYLEKDSKEFKENVFALVCILEKNGFVHASGNYYIKDYVNKWY